MEDFQKPTVGRIVHFYPGEGAGYTLPNNMEFAPAIIVQSFNDGEPYIVNLVGFQAARPDQELPNSHFNAWSIHYKGFQLEGQPYWEYLPRV